MCYIFPGSVNENQSKTRGHAHYSKWRSRKVVISLWTTIFVKRNKAKYFTINRRGNQEWKIHTHWAHKKQDEDKQKQNKQQQHNTDPTKNPRINPCAREEQVVPASYKTPTKWRKKIQQCPIYSNRTFIFARWGTTAAKGYLSSCKINVRENRWGQSGIDKPESDATLSSGTSQSKQKTLHRKLIQSWATLTPP